MPLSAPVRPRIPRGLTSDPDLAFSDAVLACMRGPAVLLQVPTASLRPAWVIATGSMERWALISDHGRIPGLWDNVARSLRIKRAPAARANLLRMRRESLQSHLPLLTWQDTTLSEVVGGLSQGIYEEAPVVCLWWLLQHQAGAPVDTAWMMLGLLVPTPSLPSYTVRTDGLLDCQGYQVVYRT